MSFFPDTRVKRYLPALLAFFMLLPAGLRLFQELRSFRALQHTDDQVTAWDARMRRVLTALPSDVSAVGYITIQDLDPSVAGRDQAEFYLTQYGLAPLVVRPGSEYDWIVGNFGNVLPRAEIQSLLAQKFGADSFQDLGFGIYLIHRPPA